MAATAIHLMDTGTAKKSSLGDLPLSFLIAMIARSPSSFCPCRNRRSCSIDCFHPVNPLERGEFPLGSVVHRVRLHIPGALDARLIPGANSDPPPAYPGHWLRVTD